MSYRKLIITLNDVLSEKCPYSEFFLVRIFPHSDSVQRTPNTYTFYTVVCPNFESHRIEIVLGLEKLHPNCFNEQMC